MIIHRITHLSDKYYPAFLAVYSVSFPLHEQRNESQQEYALKDKHYHLDCYLDEEKLLSFIAYWDFDTYYYIEHFAVNPACRGINIGTKTLVDFIQKSNRTVLLEIDPLIDEVSRKRYKFYERLKFVTNPYQHFHPAYNDEYKPHELIVLSFPGKIQGYEYQLFYKDLAGIVMRD